MAQQGAVFVGVDASLAERGSVCVGQRQVEPRAVPARIGVQLGRAFRRDIENFLQIGRYLHGLGAGDRALSSKRRAEHDGLKQR
jgi:hypothetical protein